MKRYILPFLLFLFVGNMSASEPLRIQIFTKEKPESASFARLFGQYTLQIDLQTQIRLNRTDRLSFAVDKQKVKLFINDTIHGSYQQIQLTTSDLRAFFNIDLKKKGVPSRNYDDNLEITVENGRLRLINVVHLDNYIAGVVQSETWGATTNPDFFHVQAIASRNFVLTNLRKHQKEKHNLCDGVHCQAYYGRANQPEVIEGVVRSHGEVIVDSDNNKIEALYFSNSGGETVNAKDVWSKEVPYLVGKIDSFSLGMKASTWEKYIPQKEWIRYFRNHGVAVQKKEIKQELLNFSQDSGRKTSLFGIPLVRIRKDFKLRSTFFSVEEWGGNIKLKGRGYGHGVGLSQEGAIRMCDEGYEYWEIIEFYYTNTRVVRIDENQLIHEAERVSKKFPLDDVPPEEKNESESNNQ